MSREKELRAAVKRARLLPRDFLVFVHLLDLADYRTAVIPDRFQPKSARDLAAQCGTSLRSIQRSVQHLEGHGWIGRTRDAIGRGYATRYALTIGAACTCRKPGRPRKGVNSGTLPGAGRVPELHTKGCQVFQENAGQTSDSAGGQRGEKVEGPPVCAVCGTAMNLRLADLGYRTHPCCDPAEVIPGWPAPDEASFLEGFIRWAA